MKDPKDLKKAFERRDDYTLVDPREHYGALANADPAILGWLTDFAKTISIGSVETKDIPNSDNRLKLRKMMADMYSGWVIEKNGDIKHLFDRISLPALATQIQSVTENYKPKTQDTVVNAEVQSGGITIPITLSIKVKLQKAKDQMGQLNLMKAVPALPPHPPAIVAPASPKASPTPDVVGDLKNANVFLQSIADHESSSGRNLKHPVVTKGIHKGTRAGSAYALMPKSFQDFVRGDKHLSKYAPIAAKTPDEITDALNNDPVMAREVATSHHTKLLNHFHGDHVKAAHAWLNGAGGTDKASDEDIKKHPYVTTYLENYAKHSAASMAAKVKVPSKTPAYDTSIAPAKPMIAKSDLAKTEDANTLYVACDGDGIGALVEQAAEKNDLETIKKISKAINAGQDAICAFAKASGGSVYVQGGDDVAFTLPKAHESKLEDLRRDYLGITGHTLTIGVGHRISDAANALMLGKLSGKDRIQKWEDDSAKKLKELVGEGEDEKTKLAREGLLGKSDLEKMAIKDIKQGGKIGEYYNAGHKIDTYDYSHLLSPEHRKNGYVLVVKHQRGTQHDKQWISANVTHHDTWCGGAEGGLFGENQKLPKGTLRIEHAAVSAEHRKKGLGTALYEAVMAHGHHHGATRVLGDSHSTSASATHSHLAAKHGMDYKPQADPLRAYDRPGEYDDKFEPYSYTIKSEDPNMGIEKGDVIDLKKPHRDAAFHHWAHENYHHDQAFKAFKDKNQGAEITHGVLAIMHKMMVKRHLERAHLSDGMTVDGGFIPEGGLYGSELYKKLKTRAVPLTEAVPHPADKHLPTGNK